MRAASYRMPPDREPVGAAKSDEGPQPCASYVVRGSAALRTWIEAIWDCRIDDAAAARRSRIEILPSAFPIVTFQCGDPLARSVQRQNQGSARSACAGVQNQLVRLHPQGRVAFVTVRLTPWALSQLVREPAESFADRGVDLRSLWRAGEVAAIESELAEIATPVGRVERVEAFLAERLERAGRRGAAAAALALIASGKARTIAEAAGAVGLSERQLNRVFRQDIGVGPKRFARVARIERLMKSYLGTRSWADAACDAGFSDQAHLVREFDALVGETPERFMRARVSAPTATFAAPMLGFVDHAPAALQPRHALAA